MKQDYNAHIWLWSKMHNTHIWLWSKTYNLHIWLWSKKYNTHIRLWRKTTIHTYDCEARRIVHTYDCEARHIVHTYVCEARCIVHTYVCEARCILHTYVCEARRILHTYVCEARCIVHTYVCEARRIVHTYGCEARCIVHTYVCEARRILHTYVCEARRILHTYVCEARPIILYKSIYVYRLSSCLKVFALWSLILANVVVTAKWQIPAFVIIGQGSANMFYSDGNIKHSSLTVSDCKLLVFSLWSLCVSALLMEWKGNCQFRQVKSDWALGRVSGRVLRQVLLKCPMWYCEFIYWTLGEGTPILGHGREIPHW